MLPGQGLRLYFYRDAIDGICILFNDLNRQCLVDEDTQQRLSRLVEARNWSSAGDQIVDIWPLPNDYMFNAKWLADRIGKFLIAVDILIKTPS